MSYEITVKRTVDEQVGETEAYQKIAETGGDDGGAKWGYVTRPPHIKKVTETVFSQKVEELNILKFVAAVNKVDW